MADPPEPVVEEAAALALFIKKPHLFTRSDYDTWILRHMLRPFSIIELDNEYIDIVEVSTDSHTLPWARGFTSEDAGRPLSPDNSLSPLQRPILYEPVLPHPIRAPIASSAVLNRRFCITPETRIYSFAARYRAVFVLDSSPSMSVVDDTSGKAKTLISTAFETLCKCLDGLCRPFSVESVLRDGAYDVQPVLYVTIIAQCGTAYFRGDESPSAAKFTRTYPKRVLMQEVLVTRANLETIAERLYDALNGYEDDLVQMRQRDARAAAKAPSVGSVTVERDEPIITDPEVDASSPTKKLASSFSSYNSSSVYKAINSGLFALSLLPEDCVPALVFITDGVVSATGNGEQIARDCCRKLSEEHALFTIIQVGAEKGYTPLTNFGHVADNEFLRFLAISGSGNFLYNADCPYLDTDNTVSADRPPPPNFYHRQLFFRQCVLTKSGTENRYRLVNGSYKERAVDCVRGRLLNASVDTTQNISLEELSFPWEPTSKPPMIAEILCGYRDYTVNTNLDHIISARLNEGFILRSLHVARRPNRADKVEIVLTMPWFLNVTILYKIKTTWATPDRDILVGRSQSKPPRIELNILAQHAFAILFINVQNLEQKNVFNHAMQEKLVKLHGFLKGICESDDALKVVGSFNSKYALSVVPQPEQRSIPMTTDNLSGLLSPGSSRSQPSSGAGSQNNYWSILTQYVNSRTDSFHQWKCDVILRSTSGGDNMRTTRRQVATIYLNEYLASEWASFVVDIGVFVRFLYKSTEQNGDTVPKHGTQPPTGFCMLRLTWIDDHIVTLHITFLGSEVHERKKITVELTNALQTIEHSVRNSALTFRPLIVCRKPLSQMLIRYEAIGEEESDGKLLDMRSFSQASLVSMTNDDAAPGATTKPLTNYTDAHLLADSTVKSFLRNHRCLWLNDVGLDQLGSDMDGHRTPLHELAFQLLYHKRLEEGFVPVNESTGLLTLYREDRIPVRGGQVADKEKEITSNAEMQDETTICSVQIVLIKDQQNRNVITELWTEALIDGPAGAHVSLNPRTESLPVNTIFKEHYDLLAERIIDHDRRLVSRLYTFDRIYALGQAGGGALGSEAPLRGYAKKFVPGRSTLAITTVFNLDSVLGDADFATVVYHFPVVLEGDEVITSTISPPAAKSTGSPPRGAVTPPQSLLRHDSSIETPARIERPATPLFTHTVVGTVGDNTPASNLSRATSNRLLKKKSGELGLSVNIPPPKPELLGHVALPSPAYWMSLEAVFFARTRRDRVILTLCRYMEKMLGVLTDGEINLGNSVPRIGGSKQDVRVDVLERVRDTIVKAQVSADMKEDVRVLLTRIAESKCYVKIRDAQHFLLIFLPQYQLQGGSERRRESVLSLDKATNLGEERSGMGDGDQSPSLLGLTVVECQRPRLPSSGVPITDIPPFEPLPVEVYTSAGIVLRLLEIPLASEGGHCRTPDGHVLVEGSVSSLRLHDKQDSQVVTMDPPSKSPTSDQSIPSCFSEHSQQFIGQLNGGFSCAFIKSVYAALLQGYNVDENDVEKTLENCVETSIDIDITDYLNVRMLRMRKVHDGMGDTPNDAVRDATPQDSVGKATPNDAVEDTPNDSVGKATPNDGFGDATPSLDESIQLRFLETLQDVLEPVPCFDGKSKSVYFYRPETEETSLPLDAAPKTAPPISQRHSAADIFASNMGSMTPGVDSSHPRMRPLLHRKAPTPDQSQLHMSGTAAVSSQFETLFKILECAETPLFVRTECSFQKHGLVDVDHSHIPVSTLPTSYRMTTEGETPDEADFTPENIGTESSPLESTDATKAILHIVVLTAPRIASQEDASLKMVAIDGDTSDIPSTSNSPARSSPLGSELLERSPHSHTDILSLLDSEKQAALHVLTKQVESLLQDEVMHQLLSFHPVGESILRLVENILRTRHALDSIPTDENSSPTMSGRELGSSLAVGPSLAIKCPLVFVRATVGVEMFKTQLEGTRTETGRIMKAGDFFYLLDDASEERDEHLDDNNGIVETSIVQGLGISMEDIEGAGNVTTEQLSSSPPKSQTFQPPRSHKGKPRFWLIITVDRLSAHVHFFSKTIRGYNRLAIMKAVRDALTECCERVNRAYLLSHLSESHSASKYLIAATPDEMTSPASAISNGEEDDTFSNPSPPDETTHGRFPPGRFACSSVFRHSFPLHWRLRPQQALNNIVVALQGFGIANRKNMFVFSAKGSVFYMRMSIHESQDAKEKDVTRQDSDRILSAGSVSESPLMRRSTVSSIVVPSVSSAALSATPSRTTDHAIILEVFGIDPPGPEITKEFVSMVEVKINSLTQHVLGMLLARNVTIKLTRADLDFILPARHGVRPERQELFRLPAIVKSPFVFLLLLRQSLLAWLHILGGADVVSGLRDYYEETFGWAERVSDGGSSKSSAYEIQIADFSFLYNSVPTRHPTEVETVVGQGIACLCLALLDENGKVVVEAPGVGAGGGAEGTVSYAELLSPLDEFYTRSDKDAADHWKGYKIVAQLWCHGSIHLDGFIGLLEKAVENTLRDYIIEAAVGKLLMRAMGENREPGVEDRVLSPDTDNDATSPEYSEELALKLRAAMDEPEVEQQPAIKPISQDFSEFYATLAQALQWAAEAKDPTVQHLASLINVPHWIIEEFAAEIRSLLSDNPTLLPPIILRRIVEDNEVKFEPYRPMKGNYYGSAAESPTEGNVTGDLYIALVGLEGLNARYGPWRIAFPAGHDRSHSFESDFSGRVSTGSAAAVIVHGAVAPGPSGATQLPAALKVRTHLDDSETETASTVSFPAHHPRRPSRGFQAATSAAPAYVKTPLDDVMLYPGNLHPAALELGTRSSFLLMSIENDKLLAFTYNWNRAQCEAMFSQTLKVLGWNNLRIQFLEKELASLKQLGMTRQLSLRIPQEINNKEEPVSVSYGGDSLAMAMSSQFAQRAVVSLGNASNSVSSAAEVAHAMDVDALQRHAVEFFDWLVRHIRVQQSADLRSPRSFVTSPYGEGNPASDNRAGKTHVENSVLSASEMAEMLRSVRLLHFVKYPLLFTELRNHLLASRSKGEPASQNTDRLSVPAVDSPTGSNIPSPWISSPQGDEDPAVSWYRQMIGDFLKDYVSYLQTIGLEPVSSPNVGDATFSSCMPKYWMSSVAALETGVAYLLRWFASGVLIAQVGVDGVFACVNLYTLNFEGRISVDLNGSVEGDNVIEEDEQAFAEACNRYKVIVHLNSYAYDFHIRYFQNILERRVRQLAPVDVLTVMKAFAMFNPRKANFAQSRIHHGSCAIDDGQVSSSLFQYILKNPLRYGFHPILYQGQPIGCSFTSSTPDFKRRGSGNLDDSVNTPEILYTIVVFPATDDQPLHGLPIIREEEKTHQRKSSAGSSGKLNLRYFLLVVNIKNPFPLKELETKRTSVMGTAMLYDALHEYIADGYYLKDIVRHAERKVERLVEQAIRYYGRDNLWRQLLKAQDPVSIAAVSVRSPDGSPAGDGMYEWTKLFLEKIQPNSRPLLSIAPDLNDIFKSSSIPWLKVLDHLRRFYANDARELADDNGRRHLILFNPENGDYLLHFVVHADTTSPAGGGDVTPFSAASPARRATTPMSRPRSASSVTGQDHTQSVSITTALPDEPIHSATSGANSSMMSDYRAEVFAVSREGVADEVEYRHISDVVNTIAFWFWEEVSKGV